MSDPEQLLQEIREKKDYPELKYPIGWNPAWPLIPYQKVGAVHLLLKKRFVLGDPVGSGKSPQSLFASAKVRQVALQEGLPTFWWIVSTKSATRQWEEQIRKFLTIPIPIYRMESVIDTKPKRLDKVKRWLDDKNGPVLIQNWTQFSNDWPQIKATLGSDWLKHVQVVLDEAHRVKNPESQLGGVAREVLATVDRCHGLTATLVRNKAHDAHATLEIIAPGVVMSQTVFDALYCDWEYGERWVGQQRGRRGGHKKKYKSCTGYHNLDDYRLRIAPVYLGRTEDELEGQRPKVSYQVRYVDLPREHRSMYLEAERGILLEDPLLAGAAAMVQAQQVANNPEVVANREEFTVTTTVNSKAQMFMELLQEDLAGDKVLAYSPLETTVSAFQAYLAQHMPELKVGRITGKESNAARDKARDDFQNSPPGETHLLLITDAGGESLNLQAARHVVFISRPWAPGTYTQVVGRARRFGSEFDVINIWHLTCTDTIDEYVDGVLHEKYGSVEEICRGRESLMPDDKILPFEIAQYARKKRLKK